jgi:hypothetical protein
VQNDNQMHRASQTYSLTHQDIEQQKKIHNNTQAKHVTKAAAKCKSQGLPCENIQFVKSELGY